MSKKSAKSKGFRKQAKPAKPYLSKKEIIITVVIVLLVIAGFIVMNNIPDGSVKIVDGAAVVQGENPILNTVTQKNGKLHYFMLGNMNEVEGYTLEAESLNEDVSNYCVYNFTPDGENAVDSASVTGVGLSVSTKTDAETYCSYNQAYAKTYAVEGMDVGDVNEGKTESGHAYYYYTYTLDDATYQASLTAESEEAATEEEAPAEETVAEEEAVTEEAEATEEATEEAVAEEEAEETQNFHQNVVVYVEEHDKYFVYINITNDADSADEYLTDEQIAETVSAFANAISFVEK